MRRETIDHLLHAVTDPYCRAKVFGCHLPAWGLVQLAQWHVCNWSER